MTLDYTTQQEIGIPGQLQEYLYWSDNHIIERLKQRLASVVDSFDNRTYYFQALNYLKSGAFKPTPKFIVERSDLTQRLIDEINRLDNFNRKFVLKQACGRIIEDVNFELYHNSISRVLEVELK